MPFFQNPFNSEFRGHLAIGDRQYSMTFSVPANPNRSDLMMAYNPEPYDLSSTATLTINYAYDADFKNYGSLAIDVSTTAVSTSAVKAAEVCSALNANATFSGLFVASVAQLNKLNTVLIRSLRERTSIRVYLSNTSAETKLGFNKKAGVVELPTYFARHTIANRRNYPDSLAELIQLNTGDATDQAVITNAGLNYSVVQTDYALFKGRSGLFTFKKQTVDGSDRVTQIIEYPAGAVAGDFAKKTVYSYTSSNKNPDSIVELPYTLADSDILAP